MSKQEGKGDRYLWSDKEECGARLCARGMSKEPPHLISASLQLYSSLSLSPLLSSSSGKP